MADHRKEITNKIKDGSYFSDAREWYMSEYVHPITQRSFFIIIAVVLVITLSLSLINLSNLSGGTNEIPLPIMTDGDIDTFPFIKPLTKKNEDVQEAVAKYLLIDYLKLREEYKYDEMHGKEYKYKIKQIKSSSSKKVLSEYQSYMSTINPYSPFVRFNDKITRKINVKSLKFLSDDKASGQAIVQFEAIETANNSDTQEANKSNWEATIHFSLPDIKIIARSGAPFRFMVKYYRVKLVK